RNHYILGIVVIFRLFRSLYVRFSVSYYKISCPAFPGAPSDFDHPVGTSRWRGSRHETGDRSIGRIVLPSFRFIHTGDIHLDSPLKGLAGQQGAAAERIRTATRVALDNLVTQAIGDKIDFVVI